MAIKKTLLLLLLSLLLVSSAFARLPSREEEGQQEEQGREDPQQRLQECKQECRQQQQQQRGQSAEQQRQQCEQECDREYYKQKKREEQEQEERPSSNNPYVFQQGSFRHAVRTDHGTLRVLPNFACKSLQLLGIANYRMAILEANPNTFVMPHHFDADAIFFVVAGEGSVAQIRQGQDRQSSHIRQGDMFRVQAGTLIYIINTSTNQKLRIAKILRPVSNPAQFHQFFTVGGPEPDSYYTVFSNEILEAALNTRRDKLQKVIGQQRQGAIIQASQEEIRALISSEHWPLAGSEDRPFNLLSQRPAHSNDHGRLHMANRNDYRPLRDLDIRVVFANISRGSMAAPYFNSKAIQIAIVTSGRGYLEMASPRSSSQQQGSSAEEQYCSRQSEEEQEQQRGPRYRKVRAQLSMNTVFIAPPGHPLVIVASREQDLHVLCFEVNAENDRKTYVAGRHNLVNRMERLAKEFAFGVSSDLVDEVFTAQPDDVFVRGPESSQQSEREEERRPPALESILQFRGF